MKSTLVLPAYNEEDHIGDLVKRAFRYVDQIIVVDDFSQDCTFERAKNAGAITLRHCSNLGKAGALKTGCEAAILLGTDVIALMDSDGQNKPEDLPRFFSTFDKKSLEIIIGSRRGGDRMPFARKMGNQLLRLVCHLLYRVNIQDVQSGFRVFRADVYPKLKWISSNYHADAEMTIRIGIHNLKYEELFIDTIYLDDYKGMNAIDGLKLLFNFLKWRIIL